MKNKMGELPLDGGKTGTCANGTLWPPVHIQVYGSAEEARFKVPDPVYLKLKTYEQVCGLEKMGEKCKTCPYLVVDGIRVKPPGGGGLRPFAMLSKEDVIRDIHGLKKRPLHTKKTR